MSEPDHARAAEIIAAYGADPARWPDAELPMVLAAIAASPDLRAALSAARMLDAELVAWAQAPVADGDAGRAAALALRRSRSFGRWAWGTSIAASFAAAAALLVPAHSTHSARPPATATDDAAAFAQVFTPTPDEEQVL